MLTDFEKKKKLNHICVLIPWSVFRLKQSGNLPTWNNWTKKKKKHPLENLLSFKWHARSSLHAAITKFYFITYEDESFPWFWVYGQLNHLGRFILITDENCCYSSLCNALRLWNNFKFQIWDTEIILFVLFLSRAPQKATLGSGIRGRVVWKWKLH